MPKVIIVNTAQLSAARGPDVLETKALGSCVGIVLFDAKNKVGGLAHAMLPTMEKSRERSKDARSKFVDTAIDDLIVQMEKLGGEKKFFRARLVGGANMFPDVNRDRAEHIGLQNVLSAKKKLWDLKIPIVAEETGASCGRSISLDTASGRLKVRSAMVGEKEI